MTCISNCSVNCTYSVAWITVTSTTSTSWISTVISYWMVVYSMLTRVFSSVEVVVIIISSILAFFDLLSSNFVLTTVSFWVAWLSLDFASDTYYLACTSFTQICCIFNEAFSTLADDSFFLAVALFCLIYASFFSTVNFTSLATASSTFDVIFSFLASISIIVACSNSAWASALSVIVEAFYILISASIVMVLAVSSLVVHSSFLERAASNLAAAASCSTCNSFKS